MSRAFKKVKRNSGFAKKVYQVMHPPNVYATESLNDYDTLTYNQPLYFWMGGSPVDTGGDLLKQYQDVAFNVLTGAETNLVSTSTVQRVVPSNSGSFDASFQSITFESYGGSYQGRYTNNSFVPIYLTFHDVISRHDCPATVPVGGRIGNLPLTMPPISDFNSVFAPNGSPVSTITATELKSKLTDFALFVAWWKIVKTKTVKLMPGKSYTHIGHKKKFGINAMRIQDFTSNTAVPLFTQLGGITKGTVVKLWGEIGQGLASAHPSDETLVVVPAHVSELYKEHFSFNIAGEPRVIIDGGSSFPLPPDPPNVFKGINPLGATLATDSIIS